MYEKQEEKKMKKELRTEYESKGKERIARQEYVKEIMNKLLFNYNEDNNDDNDDT